MDHNHQENSAEAWLTDVFKHSPDMIIVLDREGIIRNANVAFQTFCGRSSSMLLGCKTTEFIPVEKRSQWPHDLNKLTSGEWTSLDSTFIGAKNHAVPCHVTLISHSTHAGQPVAILHLQDASVYHSVERAMVAAQEQWERSFDAIADYMCLLDLSGHILRANQAMTKRFKPLYGNLVGCDYRKIFGADALAKGTAMPHAVESLAPFSNPKNRSAEPEKLVHRLLLPLRRTSTKPSQASYSLSGTSLTSTPRLKPLKKPKCINTRLPRWKPLAGWPAALPTISTTC